MNNIAEEIEGSTQGGALAADNGASPYSLTNLRDIICDIRLLGYEGNVCRLFDNNAEESE